MSVSALRRRLSSWVSQLQPGAPSAEGGAFSYTEHGLRLEIRAIPRIRPISSDRAIGIRSAEAFIGNPAQTICASLEDKAKKYGDLAAPYVIAVNAFGDDSDPDDIFDALLGTPCVHVRRKLEGGYEHREDRARDGLWVGNSGPRNKQVSAVMSIDRLHSWSLGQRRGRLLHNPYANFKLPLGMWGVDETNWNAEGDVVQNSGAALHEILGLPEGWPG